MEKAYGYLIQIVEKLDYLEKKIDTLEENLNTNSTDIQTLNNKIVENNDSLKDYIDTTFAKKSDITDLYEQINNLDSRVYYLENSNQGSSLDITSITFFNGGLSSDVGEEYIELNGGDAEDFSIYYIIDSNGVY